MKLRPFALYLLFAITGMLVLCGDSTKPEEEEEGNDPVDPRSFIGTFLDILPAKSEYNMPNPIEIGINIVEGKEPSDSTDSTFLLYAKEMSVNKYLYKHTGIWKINGNTIKLIGKSCEMIDVTTGANTLETQHDSISFKNIELDTTLVVDNVWETIPLIDLGSIVRAIPQYNTIFLNGLLGSDVDLEKELPERIFISERRLN